MNIQHSQANDGWQTPPEIVDLATRVLGHIDLDPASDEKANETILASRILTQEDDSLFCDWPTFSVPATIWLNPPGGKRGGKSNVRLFWRKLMAHREAGHLGHAIFAFFSIEGLQTTQGDHPAAMDFPLCVPAKRVKFVHPGGLAKHSPSHSNAFVYVPGTVDKTDEFLKVFSELGRCKI